MGNEARVYTPHFRVAFPQVFTPAEGDMDKGFYSVVMLFPKDEDLSVLKRAAKAAAKEKWGDKIPKGLRQPFRDGDEKELTGYSGHIFVKAKTKYQPGLVDAKRNPIIDPTEFYAGCWAHATVSAAAYDFNGTRGVKFYLHNIQKLKDDDAFVGGFSVQDDFGAPEQASQDADLEDDWG